MTLPESTRNFQHNVLLQSLYPSKSEGAGPAFAYENLRHAKSDVFTSLLFGGRILTSAGALFDSPISIRVFGELFSHKDFEKIAGRHGWQPLIVNTDLLERSTPVEFVLKRWRNPEAKFGFFREFDANAESGISKTRSAVVKFLEEGSTQVGRLNGGIRDLYTPYKAKDILAPSDQLKENTYKAVLENGAADWLMAVFDYLGQNGNFQCRLDAPKPEALELFSPKRLIEARTETLTDEKAKAEILRRNKVFFRKLADNRMMNAFHIEGPRHYKHYYELISHWVETDWHSVRHEVYDTATMNLESSRHHRDLFDVDAQQKVAYFHPMTIQDHPTVLTESIGFEDFDWSVLLSIVDDNKWQEYLPLLRRPKDRELAVDDLIEFLAAKLTDFTFDNENGRIQIVAKRLTQAATVGGLGGLVGVFHSPLSALIGSDIGAGIAAVAAATTVAQKAGQLAKYTTPGFRRVSGPNMQRQLRRVSVNRLPPLVGSSG